MTATDYSELDTTFEQYLVNIALTETQAQRIDNALASLSGIFLTHFEGEVEIYVQGSFATGTTVKPLTSRQTDEPGEFDVDIVLERSGWKDALSALEEIEATLNSLDKYAPKLSATKKNSCVRIEYTPDESTGVGFHVDIVPVKNIDGQRKVAVRSSNYWKRSDSKSLIAWVQDLQARNPHITGIMLILKRMRDLAGLTDELTSIIIFSILKNSYQQTASHFDDLLNVLIKASAIFGQEISDIQITNPVDKSEDLVKAWRENTALFEDVKTFFEFALEQLSTALRVSNVSDLQEILSDDFPASLLPPNVDSLRSRELVLETNGDLKQGNIHASSRYGTKSRANLWIFFERDKPISFEAGGYSIGEQILWQVCNAKGSPSLRGDWFEARAIGRGPGTSANSAKNNENELYPGQHWIRFIGINASGKVVTRASRFYVAVRALGTGRPQWRQ